MKLKPHSLLLPLVTVLVAFLGSLFTQNGMMWYETELIQPSIIPPNWVFPIAWNVIFVATTVSVVLVWNRFKRDRRFHWIMGLFLANAVLNVLWTYFFFQERWITLALYEMILLELTNVSLMALTWKQSKLASLLLLPYTLWIAFATLITYQVVQLN